MSWPAIVRLSRLKIVASMLDPALISKRSLGRISLLPVLISLFRLSGETLLMMLAKPD